MLVYRPCEFIIQLPCNDSHLHGADGNNARDSNEERLRICPSIGAYLVLFFQIVNRISNLLHLHSSIYEEREVKEAKANDLDGVLESKRIVHKQQLEEKSEDVQGEEGRDCTRSSLIAGIPL